LIGWRFKIHFAATIRSVGTHRENNLLPSLADRIHALKDDRGGRGSATFIDEMYRIHFLMTFWFVKNHAVILYEYFTNRMKSLAQAGQFNQFL
jgi:hypothetical protein